MLVLVFWARLKMVSRTSAFGKRRFLVSISAFLTNSRIIDFWSSVSMIEKLRVKPISSAWRRKMRLQIEWKVPPQSSLVSCGMSSFTRSNISRDALLVKVRSRIFLASTCWSSRNATRYVRVRVFPLPAPAMTSECPGREVTAACCCSFSSAR